ncbi:hypothetical protein GOP47_0013456 [Adiantum capillus-veneris]|uniref:non-specific serine/threonine protein kinase n=1 Tax=Adiantum capillus-veneris TaxID=13818 RepID=A0A9D4UNJ5_ADICA|nr:hypothetical protein GOP47_0013456 [Adiantum capillus-veneris]
MSFKDVFTQECLFGLKVYAVIAIVVGVFLVLFVCSITIWINYKRKVKSRNAVKLPIVNTESSRNLLLSAAASHHKYDMVPPKPIPQTVLEKPTSSSGNISEDRITVEKEIVHIRHGSTEIPSSAETHKSILVAAKTSYEIGKSSSEISKQTNLESGLESASNAPPAIDMKEGEEQVLPFGPSCPSPSDALVSHLGWGHWYSLKDLEAATDGFSDSKIVGKGGYGIVYHGILIDGATVAVKKLVNTRGQAEREFKVEVEAIGRVRHKNLVRLLGYCMEGPQRMLVYEYIDNGNLDQWLHGSLGEKKPLSWDMRMKIIIGTAKGLAYLHEGLEPKVVHRDVKSSNILIDGQWNPRISDFGLAKLLGAENTHVTTRVMGTFGYVAPEYASTGLLNEKSDVYSYGVLLMELITGRDPVDYNRPPGEVNLVDWLKNMVGSRRSEEVADPKMEVRPSLRSLKRALLVSLRCVDPDALKRPKMSHVIHMLETDDNPFREDRKSSHDLLPRAKSNPHHLQTILQNQGISFDGTSATGTRRDSSLRRVVSRDALLPKDTPMERDSEIDSSVTYDPKARWKKLED